MTHLIESELSYRIIGAAIEVQKHLGGPGLLEGVYESALCHELSLRGLSYKRQVRVPVLYKDKAVRDPMYIDILVEDKVIVEVKATEKEHPIHLAQLLTYLRLSKKELGLVINFGQGYVADGVRRVVNTI